MSKIGKLISSALNNSSANEAAQALKMAAVTMQAEGVNPAEFLQEKGANDTDSADLREAKELAIHWHRVAKAQEQQLSELAVVAVKAQEDEKKAYNRYVDWKNRTLYTIAAGLIGVFVMSMVSYSNGEDYGRVAQANILSSQLSDKDSQIEHLKAQLENRPANDAETTVNNLAAAKPAFVMPDSFQIAFRVGGKKAVLALDHKLGSYFDMNNSFKGATLAFTLPDDHMMKKGETFKIKIDGVEKTAVVVGSW